jgi:ATP-dependent DNA ligase
MIPYLNFNYIYPPRPEYKIPPKDLDNFDTGEYIVQPKYNGTCCIVFTNGNEVYVYNRHKQPLSWYSSDIEFEKLAQSNQWYVYTGEYLNKGKLGETGTKEKDKFIIWDILVWADQYLIGDDLLTRIKLLEETFPCQRAKINEDGLEMYEHLCHTDLQNIYKAPSYMNGFSKLFKDICKTDLYEGLVIKKIDSKLSYGFQELNNHDWQIKCRKPTKVYHF